jgi:hypothetical protein
MPWFSFVKNRQPNPGAQSYALASFRQVTDGLVGNATMTYGHISVMQPPQSGIMQTVPTVGLGGPQVGAYVGAPLFDLSTQGVQTSGIIQGDEGPSSFDTILGQA